MTYIRRLPSHVGVVMDGNRRWAKAAGYLNPSAGHQYGADHIENLLAWCTSWTIEHVTVYVLSADNIHKRSTNEVDHLFGLLTDTLPELVARSRRWTLHVSGDPRLLPAATRRSLRDAEGVTAGRPAHLTMAIGYDGRRDIVDGIRQALRTYGSAVDVDAITASLPGGPVKEIDLVVRTGGEHRISGFFPWQSARAEIFVSPKMWPDFTAEDFAEALTYYADHAI